jgi:three-Cys-motif partner protein
VPKSPNGNCPNPLPDGHPAQCVGAWALDKHHYVGRYIEATRATRKKYLVPAGTGGAAYIDLFAGPGRARISETGQVVDGSPLLALNHADAPFTDLVLCDLDAANVSALRARTSGRTAKVNVFQGDSNREIAKITRVIPPRGLNVALVDPFRPSDLRWSTIEMLAGLDRLDLIVNFGTGFIRRNLFDPTKPDYDKVIDAMLPTGFPWRQRVRSLQDAAKLIDCFREALGGLGYDQSRVRHIEIKNQTNTVMYHLVFASKKGLGTKIWNSIAKSPPDGQRELF